MKLVFGHSVSTAQKIEEKISNYFGNKIRIENGKTRKGNIIFSASLSTEEAIRKQNL